MKNAHRRTNTGIFTRLKEKFFPSPDEETIEWDGETQAYHRVVKRVEDLKTEDVSVNVQYICHKCRAESFLKNGLCFMCDFGGL